MFFSNTLRRIPSEKSPQRNLLREICREICVAKTEEEGEAETPIWRSGKAEPMRVGNPPSKGEQVHLRILPKLLWLDSVDL